jgi:hypothetical protein
VGERGAPFSVGDDVSVMWGELLAQAAARIRQS